MNPNIWWLIVLAVLVGHFGLNLAIYNRINALGLPRKVVKRFVKFFFVLTFVFPSAIAYFFPELVIDLCRGRPQSVSIPPALQLYGGVCLSTWLWLGIPWLWWRPIFGREWVKAARRIKVVDVQETLQRPLSLSTKCKLESRLPMNQIFELAIEEIDLPVIGLPRELDGYRIAHLTDIHLTGHVHGDFSKYVVECATQWGPDLMAVTGDIIDAQPCVDWIADIFSGASAPDGCCFVLGNHDTRIQNPQETRDAMSAAGWINLGGRELQRELRGVRSRLVGNEHPWFPRPEIDAEGDEPFRLLLSHSPDQLAWAREHNMTLMLAGHTHGGQGRLPLAGPILSPSFHGSRYASGDFFKPPTTMHVSRGLSGTHLIRIRCRPELSLLTLVEA